MPKLGRSKIRNEFGDFPRSRNLADRPNTHLSPTLSGGWDDSVASAWRAVSLAGISQLVEMSSLFLITGNLSLRLRKGFGISALNPPGGSSFEGFPCIFPVDQGSDSRDEFAPDCLHRHSVCCCGDFPHLLRHSLGILRTDGLNGGGGRLERTRLCRRFPEL